MADELAGKLALIAAALAVGEGNRVERPAQGSGTPERRPRGRPSGTHGHHQRPRPALDPSGSGRGLGFVNPRQLQSSNDNAGSGVPRRQHLEGLDKVTPHHIGLLVLWSVIFWAAVFGAYVAYDLWFK